MVVVLLLLLACTTCHDNNGAGAAAAAVVAAAAGHCQPAETAICCCRASRRAMLLRDPSMLTVGMRVLCGLKACTLRKENCACKRKGVTPRESVSNERLTKGCAPTHSIMYSFKSSDHS